MSATKKLRFKSGTVFADGSRSYEYEHECLSENSAEGFDNVKEFMHSQFDAERQLFFLEIEEEWVH